MLGSQIAYINECGGGQVWEILKIPNPCFQVFRFVTRTVKLPNWVSLQLPPKYFHDFFVAFILKLNMLGSKIAYINECGRGQV